MRRNDEWPAPQVHARRALARHLIGDGVELGPGHQPFETPSRCASVSYVDRWTPDDNVALFPELGPTAPFPKPDVVANFDTDRLRPLPDQSQDFVVCSHVLEHLAEPIGFLDEIHRVLRPGGIALILLPDRHRTFDRDRDPTPLAHLVDEHRRGITDVDDEHMLDFLTRAGEGASFLEIPDGSADERAAFFEWHRRRSIHVHCWDELEFLEVILYGVTDLHHGWEFVDGMIADDEGPSGIEFGYVLRRHDGDVDPANLAQRLRDDFDSWWSDRVADLRELDELASDRDERQRQVEALERTVHELRAEIDHQASELHALREVVSHQEVQLAAIRRLPAVSTFLKVRRKVANRTRASGGEAGGTGP